MSFLEKYLDRIRLLGKAELAASVENTVKAVVPGYIENFSYREHVTALLAGERKNLSYVRGDVRCG